MPIERIQKILARAGIASRRKAEEMIQEGLVTINGQPAKLGDKAHWGQDAIKVNKKLLLQVEAPIYVAFYKPKSVICALQDPQGRATLSSFLKKITTRVFPIGKLDFTSEGLILMTNDGKFVEKFQKHEKVPRIYQVKVKGHPDLEMINRIEKGITLGEFKKRLVKPQSVRVVEKLAQKAMVEVVLFEDSSADLKILFERRGFLVEKITRKAIGQVSLKDLKPGDYRFLTSSQVNAIIEHPELAINTLERENEKRVLKESRTLKNQKSFRSSSEQTLKVRKKENSSDEFKSTLPIIKQKVNSNPTVDPDKPKKEIYIPLNSPRHKSFERDKKTSSSSSKKMKNSSSFQETPVKTPSKSKFSKKPLATGKIFKKTNSKFFKKS